MWTVFEDFIEFVIILFLFCILVLQPLLKSSDPGIKPIPPAQEGEVLTTGPPGKSFFNFLKN